MCENRKPEVTAQFSLCCILVLFCFYFAQYPMQIENIVSNLPLAHMLSEAILLPVLDGATLEEFVKHDDHLAMSRTEMTASNWEQQW